MPLDPDDAARLRDIVSYGSKVGSIVGAVSLETFMVDMSQVEAILAADGGGMGGMGGDF